MKHKHYEMIVAKAENMDLVQFVYCNHSEKWKECSGQEDVRFITNGKYFLCLPQHKEACLHWLNGGELLVDNNKGHGEGQYTLKPHHNPLSDFINHPEYAFRIKPNKEKRWIVYNPKAQMIVVKGHFKTEEDAYNNMYGCKFRDNYLYIEIEVEV